MTESERPLTAAEEAAVRRALAQARHDEPIPPDVGARLDGVLAELTAQRTAEQVAGDDSVIDLDARRRRRRLTQGLVAAAAVVAVGVTVPQFVGQVIGPMGGDDSATTASVESDSGADSGAGAGEAGAEGPAAAQLAPEASGKAESRVQEDSAYAAESPPSVRASSFRRDVLKLDRGTRASDTANLGALAGCAAEVDPAALTIAVTYVVKNTETPALLAITPTDPDATPRVARLYVCSTGDLIRSVTLTAP